MASFRFGVDVSMAGRLRCVLEVWTTTQARRFPPSRVALFRPCCLPRWPPFAPLAASWLCWVFRPWFLAPREVVSSAAALPRRLFSRPPPRLLPFWSLPLTTNAGPVGFAFRCGCGHLLSSLRAPRLGAPPWSPSFSVRCTRRPDAEC